MHTSPRLRPVTSKKLKTKRPPLTRLFSPESPSKHYKSNSPPHIQAKLQYYDSYKNFGRIGQKLRLNQLSTSPTLAILNQLQKQKLKPLTLGLIQSETTNLNGFLSPRYAKAFSSGLRQARSVQRLNIQGNYFPDKVSSGILNSIKSTSLKSLNLSGNSIGSAAVQKLVNLLTSADYNLKELNLQNTNLSQEMVVQISSVLQYNRTVTHLNLAKNMLGEKSGEALGEMLKMNIALRSLDLY